MPFLGVIWKRWWISRYDAWMVNVEYPCIFTTISTWRAKLLDNKKFKQIHEIT